MSVPHRRPHRPHRAAALRPSLVALVAGVALGPLALGACSSGSAPTSAPAATAGGTAASSATASASGSSSSSASASTSSASPTSTGEVDAPSPSDLLARAKTAVESATSSHVAGTVEDSGKAVAVDVAGRTDGSSAQGSVRSPDASLEFVLVGGQTYIRGDEKFWAQAGAPAARAAQLAASKKWVKASAAEAKSFTQLANPKELLGELLGGTDANSLTQKVEATSVGGEPCWAISDRIGGNDAELDVLKSSYLPVRLVIGKGQSLTFSEWSAVKTPTAPAASEVITG